MHKNPFLFKYQFILYIVSIYMLQFVLIKGGAFAYYLSGDTYLNYETQFLKHFILPNNYTDFFQMPYTLISAFFYTPYFFVLVRNIIFLMMILILSSTFYSKKNILLFFIFSGIIGNILFITISNLFIQNKTLLTIPTFNTIGFIISAFSILLIFKKPFFLIFDKLTTPIKIWKILLCYILIDIVFFNNLSIPYFIILIISIVFIYLLNLLKGEF